MGKKKKKPFIDKKNAHSYKLVHRSQRDPLVVDEEAPQFLLKPLDDGDDTQQQQQYSYGIYYNDDYDYLQHLRSVDYTSNELELVPDHQQLPRLPPEVFPSEHEEDVGMLNKAVPIVGPRPDWDPDIVATLDDDYEHCDSLEDDFMGMANAVDPNNSNQDKLPDDDDDDNITLGSGDPHWETKSRFTEYSITSSVMPRSEGLELLDEKFEQFYVQYDDEWGSCDDDDDVTVGMATEKDKQILDKVVEDFEKNFKENFKIPDSGSHDLQDGSHDASSEEETVEVTSGRHDNQWDCESVLSTYSNLYNHPVTISDPKPIKVNKKGIPLEVLRDEKPHKDETDAVMTTVTPTRHKGETKEEKQARKQLVKQHNKQRRITKKTTQQVYKDEELLQKRTNSKSQSIIVL
ncbi:protein LTV1 homolog [Dysidea avara]|uniref:protein LTV1 homolog n=1 Tax=Dysidea avara TaxID=196820 RepID=UPI0033292E3A